jgi:hypothetical protein
MTLPSSLTPASDVLTLLEVDYQGYFMCRLATDPDPTNEDRGMSGYTMALASEDTLDQVIRLQVTPEFLARNARPPLLDMDVTIGVTVTGARFEGQPFAPATAALAGAKVYLDGSDPPMKGPIFDSRNNITGSDDTMSFVVAPYNLRIQNDATGVRLTASDYLVPSEPQKQLWQILDPTVYQRRLTVCFDTNDTEVAQATGVFDQYGYFRDRRRYLEKRIADLLVVRASAPPSAWPALDAEIQGYRTRVYQLEFWGDRVISKLQAKCAWRWDINGPQTVTGDLGGTVAVGQPWTTRFWFGGWDGDLLIGYMRGSLTLPFTPR